VHAEQSAKSSTTGAGSVSASRLPAHGIRRAKRRQAEQRGGDIARHLHRGHRQAHHEGPWPRHRSSAGAATATRSMVSSGASPTARVPWQRGRDHDQRRAHARGRPCPQKGPLMTTPRCAPFRGVSAPVQGNGFPVIAPLRNFSDGGSRVVHRCGSAGRSQMATQMHTARSFTRS